MCGVESNFFKKIKRSCEEALHLVHRLMFDDDYPQRDQVQEEFRGFEASLFSQMNLGLHYQHGNKQKALDILQFIKVLLHSSFLEKTQEPPSLRNFAQGEDAARD